MILESIKLEEVAVTKNGKKYVRAGIKIAGEWHNTTIWENQGDVLRIVHKWQKGEDVDVILFKEAGTGDHAGKEWSRFKLPTKFDELERRVDLLEQRIAGLLGEDVASVEVSSVPAHAEVRTPDNDPPQVEDEPEVEESDDLPF